MSTTATATAVTAVADPGTAAATCRAAGPPGCDRADRRLVTIR